MVNLLSLLTSSSDANLSEYLKKCHTANGETSNWALRENDLFLLHLHSLMECFILPLSFSPSHSFFSPLKMSQMHIKSIFNIPPFRSHFSGCFFLIMKHWLESAANLLNVTKMFLNNQRGFVAYRMVLCSPSLAYLLLVVF